MLASSSRTAFSAAERSAFALIAFITCSDISTASMNASRSKYARAISSLPLLFKSADVLAQGSCPCRGVVGPVDAGGLHLLQRLLEVEVLREDLRPVRLLVADDVADLEAAVVGGP